MPLSEESLRELDAYCRAVMFGIGADWATVPDADLFVAAVADAWRS